MEMVVCSHARLENKCVHTHLDTNAYIAIYQSYSYAKLMQLLGMKMRLYSPHIVVLSYIVQGELETSQRNAALIVIMHCMTNYKRS